ncbi:MAG: signal peptide peptidase SppA [Verrucomicrobia bacterium]|nr:MAG: signal peptide peptidase SppA [Verrucomicrobiota bacterium]
MDTNPPPLNPVPPPPPPQFSAPPIITPPPTKPPRKSRGWMIVSIILFLLLGLSMLFNVGSIFSLANIDGARARGGGPKLDEVVVEEHDSRNKIAIVPVEGIISGRQVDQAGNSMVEIIKAQLDRAKEDEKVKAVILRVDSPGGEVLASDEINKLVVKFQKESSKPVIASMGSLAASGGYYVSAPCRWIVAHEMTITGSIGVIMSTWNYRGLMNKVGLQPYTFKSGKFKDMLSGSRDPADIPAEERAMVQGLIDETYGKFKSVVQDGRDRAAEKNKKEAHALAENWTDFADGRILTGREALKLGFVDQIGNFDDAVDRTEQIAGIKKANLVEYRERHGLAELLGVEGKSQSRAVKIELGIELPKLEAGKAYFLYLP